MDGRMDGWIHPRSLTKMVVRRLFSYWVSVNFQGRTVKLREGMFWIYVPPRMLARGSHEGLVVGIPYILEM